MGSPVSVGDNRRARGNGVFNQYSDSKVKSLIPPKITGSTYVVANQSLDNPPPPGQPIPASRRSVKSHHVTNEDTGPQGNSNPSVSSSSETSTDSPASAKTYIISCYNDIGDDGVLANRVNPLWSLSLDSSSSLISLLERVVVYTNGLRSLVTQTTPAVLSRESNPHPLVVSIPGSNGSSNSPIADNPVLEIPSLSRPVCGNTPGEGSYLRLLCNPPNPGLMYQLYHSTPHLPRDVEDVISHSVENPEPVRYQTRSKGPVMALPHIMPRALEFKTRQDP